MLQRFPDLNPKELEKEKHKYPGFAIPDAWRCQNAQRLPLTIFDKNDSLELPDEQLEFLVGRAREEYQER